MSLKIVRKVTRQFYGFNQFNWLDWLARIPAQGRLVLPVTSAETWIITMNPHRCGGSIATHETNRTNETESCDAYFGFTGIFLVSWIAFAVFGSVISSTPFLKVACTLSVSTSMGRGMLRVNEPYERSIL
jgi:hypothetical protein